MTATGSSLPVATRLEEFELTGVVGEGGFSTVYVALDHILQRAVAIKEYMPRAIAIRMPDGSVTPQPLRQAETFRAGLASFLNEARLLARFTHPALVHIHRVWEQNGTAYMAMQYCVGQTLRQISQSDSELVRNEAWLKTTFAPILDALELLHSESCFHRDISPDNILVLQTGGPVLLDFGAARRIIGDMTQALTVILKPGFAPIEQYANVASLQQGPWTDVYGVGAVLYTMLTGKSPIASLARLVNDPMPKLADSDAITDISPPFREAIDHALAVYPNQRIQSISELREALQLPTFKIDTYYFGGAVSSPATASAMPSEASAARPANAHVKSAGTSGGAASAAVGTQAASPPAPRQNATLAGKSGPDTSAAAPVRRSARRRSAILGVGLLVVVTACAIFGFEFLHRPSDKSGTDTRLADDPATVDIPASSASPMDQRPLTPLPADSQTSTVAPSINDDDTVAIPEKPAEDAPTLAPPGTSQEETAPSPSAVAPPSSKPPKKTSSPVTTVTPSSDADQDAAIIAPGVSQEETAPPPKPVTPSQKSQKPPKPKETSSSAAKAVPPKETQTPSAHTAVAVSPSDSRDASAPARAASQPASAPSGTTSVVRLSIRPWGQISVDGQSKGISPPLIRLSLTPGEHKIVIVNENFPPVTQTITVPEKGETVVSHRFGAE